MRFFKDCQTKEDIKKLYRELAKQFHPDKGGDLETMQAINKEYSYAIAAILRGANLTTEEIDAEILNAEQYKSAINAIINLTGIIIEICGGWIWVSGETYQHKEVFKSNGFYFASVKKMWYFRSVEYKTNNKQSHTMEEIRHKYGSQLINSSNYNQKQIA
jgi:hypothetical protein